MTFEEWWEKNYDSSEALIVKFPNDLNFFEAGFNAGRKAGLEEAAKIVTDWGEGEDGETTALSAEEFDERYGVHESLAAVILARCILAEEDA
jgi:hypothetical protein